MLGPTAEHHGTDQEPAVSNRQAGDDVGEPMNSEQCSTGRHRDGDQRGTRGQQGTDRSPATTSQDQRDRRPCGRCRRGVPRRKGRAVPTDQLQHVGAPASDDSLQAVDDQLLADDHGGQEREHLAAAVPQEVDHSRSKQCCHDDHRVAEIGDHREDLDAGRVGMPDTPAGDVAVEGREPEGTADHVQDGTDKEGDNKRHEQRHRQHEAARRPAVESLAQEPS